MNSKWEPSKYIFFLIYSTCYEVKAVFGKQMDKRLLNTSLKQEILEYSAKIL